MGKIEILGKTIGKVYVKECLGGNPLIYSCVCPCGDPFATTSQRIRSQKVDCGCGAVTGIHNKPFKIGDIYHGSQILDVFKTSEGQTRYTFKCGDCGDRAKRVHSDFIKRPVCSKCLKKKNAEERDKKIAERVIGKEVNGIKILRLSERKKSVLYVDAICPVCGKEFTTKLSGIEQGIKSCKNCTMGNLQEGHTIIDEASVEGTNILSIKPDRAVNKNSTTGYKGVNQYKSGKYRAYIVFKRKQYHLGTFDTLQQAVEARRNAEKKIFGNFIEWYSKEFPKQWERINKSGDKGI